MHPIMRWTLAARLGGAAVMAVFLGLPGLAGADPTPADSGVTLIRNVRVFDGERGLGARTVLLDHGRIANIDYRGPTPSDARVVEGTGKTLLPGLIDSHVHAFHALEMPLLFGVTTQLDMFTPIESLRDIRARMAAGTNTDKADVFTAGYLATVPGGHGTEYGVPIPTLSRADQAEDWVKARIAEGSDYIKIIIEPGGRGRGPLPTLDAPTVRALVAAAHRHGKLAVVHAETMESAEEAIYAGADGLMHLFFDQMGGTRFAALARSHHIFVVPTYVVFEPGAGRAGSATVADSPGFAPLLPASVRSALHQTSRGGDPAQLDRVMGANIRALLAAHVPILAGTDSSNTGTYYGVSLHRELELLVEAGLSPPEALRAATAAPADAFHLRDRGRIAAGLRADLLLVDGDPTIDILATRRIIEVWKGGLSANPLRAAQAARVAQAPAAPMFASIALPADGRIGLFADAGGKAVLNAPFGSGWTTTTDGRLGGKSEISLRVAGQASNGQPVLVMQGALNAGYPYPWAGIMFMPGNEPFAPADLSAASRLSFFARGTAGHYAILAFSPPSQSPFTADFDVGTQWHETRISLRSLAGFDRSQVQGLAIVATDKLGPFRLEIADIRLTD
jgi:imidazolonepropionase-like amidohydrolase